LKRAQRRQVGDSWFIHILDLLGGKTSNLPCFPVWLMMIRTEALRYLNTLGARVMNLFVRFAKNESGATAIEYGLIAALIGVGIITAATQLGTDISSTFGRVLSTLTAAGGAGTQN
jgi:pilus assembly protein Flp/PilA